MDIAFLLFVLSAGFVVYVLFIYPALLAVWPVKSRKRQASSGECPSVTIILPVRNGEKWIRQKLESIYALRYPPDRVQIVVISDGSTDKTAEIAKEFDRVELLCIPPSGKAGAINAGLAKARGELLFFTDVRQKLDPDCLHILAAQFADLAVGVASGELLIEPTGNPEQDNVGLYWRYEKWIRRRHSEIDSVLGATGAIYMMRRSLASPLPLDTLNDDMHLPFQAFFRGFRLLFVDKARAYDLPTQLQTEFRRKVRTLAGVYQVIAAFPALLTPRNRMWLHFLSHKLGRLLLPYALITAFVVSFFLAWPWGPWMAAGQMFFYGLAAIDPLLPEGAPGKRITSLVRTFVVLMIATACAASILFRSSSSFWKTPTHSSA